MLLFNELLGEIVEAVRKLVPRLSELVLQLLAFRSIFFFKQLWHIKGLLFIAMLMQPFRLKKKLPPIDSKNAKGFPTVLKIRLIVNLYRRDGCGNRFIEQFFGTRFHTRSSSFMTSIRSGHRQTGGLFRKLKRFGVLILFHPSSLYPPPSGRTEYRPTGLSPLPARQCPPTGRRVCLALPQRNPPTALLQGRRVHPLLYCPCCLFPRAHRSEQITGPRD